MEAENARLRARVHELEAENARLARENANLRVARRIGTMANAVAGTTGAADVVVEDVVTADSDMPFLNGVEVGLDTVRKHALNIRW